jgi:alpha-tubulin suppressor-like RCC1 family protein
VFVNDVPVFVSPAYVSASEGVRDTGYVAVATDANNDTLTYTISGGADGARFTLDSTSGTLSFIAAPLFGEPADINQNNIYTLDITAQDPHGGSATQTVEITVTDAPRVLTDLSVENTGSLLTASVACDECQLSATTFEWILEGSDAPVATGNSYKLPVADQLKKITVKAIPVMESGASGQPEMAELTFNKAEKVVFGYGIHAVLKTNGEVVVWGNGEDGEADYSEIVDDVDRIIEPDPDAPRYSIAAIKKDGSLVTWGDPEYGGGISNHESAMHVKDAMYVKDTRIRSVVALNEDGSVSRFGAYEPGRMNSSVDFDDLTNIRQLINGKKRTPMYGSEDLYVIDGNGDVKSFCWAPLHYCADVSNIGLSDIKEIQSAGYLFAALKNDRSLVSWGIDNRLYPNGSPFENVTMKSLPDNGLTGDVTQLVASGNAFAALLSSNEVITWGDPRNGGNPTGIVLADVDTLYSNHSSFAAKKHDGSVVIWRETGKVVADKVRALVAINSNYVAIKMDGTVGFWDVDGNDRYEDMIAYEYDDDYNVIGSAMPSLTAVKEIIGGRYSFSALKEDGTVYSWGTGNDGDSGFTNIVKIFKPQGDTYAGLDVDGNLRIWGELYDVGDVPEEDLVPTLIEISSTLN